MATCYFTLIYTIMSIQLIARWSTLPQQKFAKGLCRGKLRVKVRSYAAENCDKATWTEDENFASPTPVIRRRSLTRLG